MFSHIAKFYNLWRCVDEFCDVTYLLDETLSFSQSFFFKLVCFSIIPFQGFQSTMQQNLFPAF